MLCPNGWCSRRHHLKGRSIPLRDVLCSHGQVILIGMLGDTHPLRIEVQNDSLKMASLEVVICTHNNASMLDAALAAISSQVVSMTARWSVLVVNNNCTDNTTSVVEAYIRSGELPNLRIISERTPGLTSARHCGVRNTTAPWIAFVDNDCILQPDWVAQAILFASAHPTCGAFGGRVTLQWECSPPAYVFEFKYCFAEQELGIYPKTVNFIVGAGMVVNRSALEAVGWCEQRFLSDRVGDKLVSGGDVEIARRIASRYELWYNPACRLYHRIPAARTTFRYLMRMNYGLGSSRLFTDSMFWHPPYARTLRHCLMARGQRTIVVSVRLLKALLSRRARGSRLLTFVFWMGYWVGLWRLLRMGRRERRGLVGCARSLPA